MICQRSPRRGGREGGTREADEREREREGERERERERGRERERETLHPAIGCGGIVKQSGLPFSLASEMHGDRGEAAGARVRMGSHRVDAPEGAPSWPCQAMTRCHCPLHPSP